MGEPVKSKQSRFGEERMKVTYLGHASFKIEADEKIIFVDPWLEGPTSPIKVADVKSADIVLVTHDHGDHGYNEGIQICMKTGATFVAINELALQAKANGVKNVHTLNIGGSVPIDNAIVTLVHAFHSCGKGAPTGFVVKLPSVTFYHPGDTGVFSDMALWHRLYKPDLYFAPIGSYYTQDIAQAVLSVELVKPKVVVPMHYATFPVIDTDPEEFKRQVVETMKDVKVEVMKPGDSRELSF